MNSILNVVFDYELYYPFYCFNYVNHNKYTKLALFVSH